MKSQPITQKAKCSPLKVNEALIMGAKTASPKFTDISKKFNEGVDSLTKEKENDEQANNT